MKFSEQLDAATAKSGSNYSIVADELRGRRLVAQPIPFRATYNSSLDTVSLLISGSNAFPHGGRLFLRATAPSGITSASGTPLAGSTTFTILPRASAIKP